MERMDYEILFSNNEDKYHVVTCTCSDACNTKAKGAIPQRDHGALVSLVHPKKFSNGVVCD